MHPEGRWAENSVGTARLQEALPDGFVAPVTLVDALLRNLSDRPQNVAFQFLPDDAGEVSQASCQVFSYRLLSDRVNGLVKALRQGHAGEVFGVQSHPRVLILCPAGLEFVAAFFACLAAGAVAVPLQPPGRRQEAARWQHIVADAQPAAVITLSKLRESVNDVLNAAQMPHLPVVEADQLAADDFSEADWVLPQPEAPALLQYTSGSTGLPRGVRVTHGNLIYNLEQIRRRFAHTHESHGVIWLPPHHDMGLIGGILQPVYAGFPVTLMSPAAFLRRPSRWLQAISHFRGTTSGGPNFAYEYCLRRCTEQDIAALDLSSWSVAFNGAEAVRANTLSRFSETFAPQGFRSQAFLPCYGLAEGTLMVASTQALVGPAPGLALDREQLRNHRAVESHHSTNALVLQGSGNAVDGTQLCIVDPTTREALGSGAVGEIWVRGPGVADGYQNVPSDRCDVFNQSRADDSSNWLRTGDLGFMHNGELVVSGRLKDLIVIRGANYAPQDIELSVEQSHPRFLPSASAAFTVEQNNEEALVVVQEVERGRWQQNDVLAALDAIKGAVSREHGLQVKDIVLVKPASLPKTPSGKVQRRRCSSLFLSGGLKVAHQWSAQTAPRPVADTFSVDEEEQRKTLSLLEWLRQYGESCIDSQLMDARRSLSPAVLLDFGNQGLLGMQVPKQWGGLGLGYGSINRVIQQLAAIDTTLALFVGLNNVLGIGPILRHGSDAMRQARLPGLAAGRELAAFALTESGAGSNPNAMEAYARAAGSPDGSVAWQLFGQKIWSGSAAWAGVTTVFVRQQDEQGSATGVSAFVVPKERKGLKQGPEALTMGMRAMVQNTVELDGVTVSEADLLGAKNHGMIVAQEAMNHGRLVIAAACIGGMQRCAQLMLRYASRRTVSSGLLLNHPEWKKRLERICAGVSCLTQLVETLANRLDQNMSVPEDAYAVCKVIATEQFWRAADDLMQCLGGRGYIESNPAAQILRDARVLRIFEGPTETLTHYLGARTLRRTEELVKSWGEIAKPDALHAIEQQVEQWQQALAQGASVEHSAVQMQVGEWMCWATLQAVAQTNQTVHQQRDDVWLQQQCSKAQQQVEAALAGSGCVATQTLVNEIESFTAAIGDVEQHGSGENHALDPLLKKPSSENQQHASFDLQSIHETTAKAGFNAASESAVTESASTTESNADHTQIIHIQDWISRWLSARLSIPLQQIDPQRALADLGVDSVLAVELADGLETEFKLRESLDPTLAWSYPTIEALSSMIVGLIQTPAQKNQNTSTDWMAQLQAELASQPIQG